MTGSSRTEEARVRSEREIKGRHHNHVGRKEVVQCKIGRQSSILGDEFVVLSWHPIFSSSEGMKAEREEADPATGDAHTVIQGQMFHWLKNHSCCSDCKKFFSRPK